MATTMPHIAADLWARRLKDDPLYDFQPTAKQKPFIQSVLSPDPPYENWICASNRAGKSLSGAYCGAYLARYGTGEARPAVGPSTTLWDGATSGWLVAPSFAVLRDVLMPLYFDNGYVSPTQGGMKPFIPASEIKEWNWTSQTLKLKNGSLVRFKSNDQATLKFASAGVDWIHFDEEPDRNNYIEATLRIAAGRHLRIFGTATLLPPEGQPGGISWIYEDIIQPWLAKTRTDVAVFSASIYDNPYLLPDEIARLEARYPLGSLERRIRLGGEWLPGMAGDQVYGSFERHLHVKEQGPVQSTRPLVWAVDFNVAPFCTVICQEVGPQLKVYKEIVMDHGSIPSIVEAFRAAYPSHPHELWLYGDATGGARNVQTGTSDWRLILEYLRGYPSPVKLRVPDSNPSVHGRVGAVNLALKDHLGNVALTMDPSCTELILDMERVLSDGHGGIRKSSSTRDPYSRRTGTSDALGYWIASVRPVGRAAVQARPPVHVPAPRYGDKGPRPVVRTQLRRR